MFNAALNPELNSEMAIPRANVRRLTTQQRDQQWALNLLSDTKVGARAIRRAMRLLESFLTPEQLAEYQNTTRFTVMDPKRNRKYKLGDDLQVRVYNITDPPFAPALETWCVFVPGTPFPDTILAQLLALRSDPAKLRRRASVTPGARMRQARRFDQAMELIERCGYAETHSARGIFTLHPE